MSTDPTVTTTRTSPDRQQITDKLCELAAQQASVDRAEVTAATHLYDDLNFDSLDTVEFGMGLEEEYGVNVPDDAIERIKTVGDAVEALIRILASGER